MEDDVLVEVVVKYSTSDVLGRDWSEITSELSGHSKEKCQERNRLPDHKRHRLGGFYTTSSL